MSDSPSAITISIAPFGSPLYELTKALRYVILRAPLGLQWSEKDLAGEDIQMHIAAVDPSGLVLGAVLLKPLSEDVVKLRQMAVSNAAQGMGLGRQLVRFAEQTAQQKGFKTIEMHARVSAQGFYEKLGYTREGEEFIEVTVATVLMKKVFYP